MSKPQEGLKKRLKTFLGIRKSAAVTAGNEEKETEDFIFTADVLKVDL